MPKLTNKVTRQVVNVDDDLAAKLGLEWEAESEAPKRRSKSSGRVNSDES